jgi:hypothetical protein
MIRKVSNFHTIHLDPRCYKLDRGLIWVSGKTLVQLGFDNKAEPLFEYNRVYDSKCPSFVEEALVPLNI